MVEACKVTIAVDNVDVARVTSCSLEYSRDMIEYVGMRDAHKSRIAGKRSWSVTAESAAEFVVNNGHAKLIKAMNAGIKIAVKLTLGDGKTMSGSGYIESYSVDMSAGELAKISIGIVGTGALQIGGIA